MDGTVSRKRKASSCHIDGDEPTAAPNGGGDVAWLFLKPEPHELVTLKAGGSTFQFRRSLLVKDSQYFAACLENSAFIEAHTSTIDFDDMDPQQLGVYLHMVYCLSIGKPICNKAPVGAHFAEPSDLASLARVYQIADRFANQTMMNSLERSILADAKESAFYTRYNYKERHRRVHWIKNYKGAFEALNGNYHNQANLRNRLTKVFCMSFSFRSIQLHFDLIKDNQDLTQAVLAAILDKAISKKPSKRGYRLCSKS